MYISCSKEKEDKEIPNEKNVGNFNEMVIRKENKGTQQTLPGVVLKIKTTNPLWCTRVVYKRVKKVLRNKDRRVINFRKENTYDELQKLGHTNLYKLYNLRTKIYLFNRKRFLIVLY